MDFRFKNWNTITLRHVLPNVNSENIMQMTMYRKPEVPVHKAKAIEKPPNDVCVKWVIQDD